MVPKETLEQREKKENPKQQKNARSSAHGCARLPRCLKYLKIPESKSTESKPAKSSEKSGLRLLHCWRWSSSLSFLSYSSPCPIFLFTNESIPWRFHLLHLLGPIRASSSEPPAPWDTWHLQPQASEAPRSYQCHVFTSC